MPTERVAFPGHAGDELAARLDLPLDLSPDGRASVYALFAHCFTCGKDIAAARRIAQKLTEKGIGVLRFDFTGLGHSGGEFASTSFASNVEDLVLAAGWLAKNHAAPQILIGHSLGGAAVLAAASRIDSARAVVTIGAPSAPEHVLHNFGGSLDEIREKGSAEVTLAGRPFRIGETFVDDARSTKLEAAIGGLRKALLVMHAPLDEIVGVDEATKIFVAAKHPKSFVTLDKADHLVSRETDAAYAAEVIAAWVSRYVDAPSGVSRDEPDLAEGYVRSSEVSPDGFRQTILAGRHRLTADEPADVGGTDLGPGPYEFMGAALAACTSMTIRMYARRKNLPLTHVSVDVSHDRIYAADCEDCESKSGKVDEFRRRIRLEGDLSEAQRSKLLEIADKCPVHRTLENEIKVRTELIA